MKAPPFASITIFSEDLRQEVGGQVSLIGIYPDNLAVGEVPAMLAKLTAYTRTSFSVEEEVLGDAACVLIGPDGTELATSLTTSDKLEKARADSKAQGALMVTIVSTVQATPFPLTSEGRICVVLRYGGQEVLSGFLNVKIETPEGTAP